MESEGRGRVKGNGGSVREEEEVKWKSREEFV